MRHDTGYLFGLELLQRVLASLAAFGREREIQPHRHIGSSEFRTDGRVNGRRIGPVERGANVIDFLCSVRQPSPGRSRQGLTFRALEKIAVVFGMAAGDPFALAVLVKLLKREPAGRV